MADMKSVSLGYTPSCRVLVLLLLSKLAMNCMLPLERISSLRVRIRAQRVSKSSSCSLCLTRHVTKVSFLFGELRTSRQCFYKQKKKHSDCRQIDNKKGCLIINGCLTSPLKTSISGCQFREFLKSNGSRDGLMHSWT